MTEKTKKKKKKQQQLSGLFGKEEQNLVICSLLINLLAFIKKWSPFKMLF